MALFGPTSWVQRATVSGLVSTVVDGYRSPTDDVLWAWSGMVFVGGPGVNENVQSNNAAISLDRAGSWTVQSPAEGAIFRHWAIALPDGSVRYFRAVSRLGRNFFAGNSEIFPGYLRIEWSQDGLFFSPLQTLYSWGHTPNAGGAQAQQTTRVFHLVIPGSGPGGADADWLFVRCKIESGAGVVVDAYDRWRSDNFGETWVNVGVISGLATVTNFFGQSPSGRIIAENGSMFFSADNGATFAGAGGVLPGQGKVQVIHQAGNSWHVLLAGGLASQAASGVSCDDGGTWGGSANFVAQNSNPNGLRLSPSEILVFCRDSDALPTGVNIWYSTNGGETVTLQGKETRWPALQSSVVFSTILNTGHPLGIALNGVVLASNDRPTGNFTARTLCPLAFAGLRKAGIPNLCGHPLLQNRC